jgi:integrase
MEIDLPHVVCDRDRHGNVRVYARVHNRPKVRLRSTPGTVDFLEEYKAALTKINDYKPVVGLQPQTFEWLGRQYLRSVEFEGFKERDRANRRGVLDACFEEPLSPGSEKKIGQCPLHLLEPKHIKMLRDRKVREGFPAAANNRLKYVSALLAWGIENDHLKSNPAREVKPIRYESDGYHTWTVDEVRRFEQFWPVGSKPRLALALMLFLGLRGGDVRLLGRQHVQDGWVRIKPRKTAKKRNAETLELPILPELKRVMDASQMGNMTFIVTEYGKPFSDRGFGQWFSSMCERAGLTDCTAHGLRKAGATLAGERGASDLQLMSIYGWSSPSQAAVYTRKARRKKLAGEAMSLLSRDEE